MLAVADALADAVGLLAVVVAGPGLHRGEEEDEEESQSRTEEGTGTNQQQATVAPQNARSSRQQGTRFPVRGSNGAPIGLPAGAAGPGSRRRSVPCCFAFSTSKPSPICSFRLLVACNEVCSELRRRKDASTPLVVVVPGLTSDSAAAYVKHLAHSMASKGWNVVVSNHRGLGGVSITSDCFYNGGWTEDIREVVNYLHDKYQKAPMFCVGTSIGANILVKYLGEEGENTPVAGAASICSPWDLVVCDRFISRKLVQRFYDKALAFGLKGYAKLHQPVLARLANWEGIKKSRSIREFDHHATCIVAKYETVDTYYRRCSSASYVGNVSVPLLCVSALDDPLCTREVIPWDECRANKNIVLATTPNGGHLAFFQGLTAGRLWWVGAVSEFLGALHDSSYMHRQKAQDHVLHSSLESSIDKSPYVNIMEDGMIAPVTNDGPGNDDSPSNQIVNEVKLNNGDVTEQNEHAKEVETKSSREVNVTPAQSPAGSAKQQGEEHYVNKIHDDIAPVKRSINQLTRYQGRSVWLLAYIAFVTSWPLLGSLAFIAFRKKFRNHLPAKWLRR